MALNRPSLSPPNSMQSFTNPVKRLLLKLNCDDDNVFEKKIVSDSSRTIAATASQNWSRFAPGYIAGTWKRHNHTPHLELYKDYTHHLQHCLSSIAVTLDLQAQLKPRKVQEVTWCPPDLNAAGLLGEACSKGRSQPTPAHPLRSMRRKSRWEAAALRSCREAARYRPELPPQTPTSHNASTLIISPAGLAAGTVTPNRTAAPTPAERCAWHPSVTTAAPRPAHADAPVTPGHLQLACSRAPACLPQACPPTPGRDGRCQPSPPPRRPRGVTGTGVPLGGSPARPGVAAAVPTWQRLCPRRVPRGQARRSAATPWAAREGSPRRGRYCPARGAREEAARRRRRWLPAGPQPSSNPMAAARRTRRGRAGLGRLRRGRAAIGRGAGTAPSRSRRCLRLPRPCRLSAPLAAEAISSLSKGEGESVPEGGSRGPPAGPEPLTAGHSGANAWHRWRFPSLNSPHRNEPWSRYYPNKQMFLYFYGEHAGID